MSDHTMADHPSSHLGPTFTGSVEDFKRAVAEFCRAAPNCDRDSLENGFKAVALLYFGYKDNPATARADLAIAGSYFNYASRRYAERDIALLSDELAAE